MLGRTEANRMENDLKADGARPWTDRTYQARDRIAGRVERRGDLTRITLSHGVRYGVYLELAMGKRFAALWPKIKERTPEILKAVAKLGGGGK